MLELCIRGSFTSDRGVQEYVAYDKNAQQFILDNLEAIVVFATNEEKKKATEKEKKEKANIDIIEE